MAITGLLGTADSRPGNLVPGAGASGGGSPPSHALTGSADVALDGAATLTVSPATTETWHQHGATAARVGSNDITPAAPWRWLWSDGIDADGGLTSWRGNVPREAFPVAGNGLIYAPRGGEGIVAYTLATGAVAWAYPFGNFVASPAYDPTTDCLVAPGADGWLYKIPAGTGGIASGSYAGVIKVGYGAPIRKAVALVGRYAYVTREDGALEKWDIGVLAATTPTRSWAYAGGASAGKRAETPPAFAPTAAKIVYATSDGFVHGVNDADGSQSWRVQPHSVAWGWPNTWDWGWPVVADSHGIVLLRCQIAHGSTGSGPSTVGGDTSRFPASTGTGAAQADAATIRAWFGTRAAPGTGGAYRNLFAIRLADGAEAFVPAVGYGSVEDYLNGTGYGVLGTVPVIRKFAGGAEVAYTTFRNGSNGSPDFRWDGNIGELALATNDPVGGYSAGDLRFVALGSAFAGHTGDIKVIDEQGPLTMCGDTLLYAHWGALIGATVADRGATKGDAFANPITTSDLPPVVFGHGGTGTYRPGSRYCADSGAANQGRSYTAPVYWEHWGVTYGPNTADPPPGSPQSGSMSAGHSPRIAYVHRQYVILVGNGGEITVFRHSGTVSGVGAPGTPTALTLTGPTGGAASVASARFTVQATPRDAMPGGSITVTLSDGGAGGTFKDEAGGTITTLTLSQLVPGGTFTYTPPAGSTTRVISITNGGGLSNPAGLNYVVAGGGGGVAGVRRLGMTGGIGG